MAQAIDEEKKGSDHPQPLPNARPSIEGASDFTGEIQTKNAKALYDALDKWVGSDGEIINNVTQQHSHRQRLLIRNRYTTDYKADLIDDLRSKLSGDYLRLCVPFWYEKGVYDAEQLHNVMEAKTEFNTDLVNEIICTRSNEDIAAMKSAWKDKEKSLVDHIKSKTKNDSYSTLLVTILEGKRPPNGAVNKMDALNDAEKLRNLLTLKKNDEFKEKIVELFTKRSWCYIREISSWFQCLKDTKYTLSGTITDEFGESDIANALRTIEDFVTEPYDYWAKKLRAAMTIISMKKGGTDEDMLSRVIISRAEVDLFDVAIVFGKRYGDEKTLQNWIAADTSGDYRDLLLKVCDSRRH